MTTTKERAKLAVNDLEPRHLDDVVRIDALHTGHPEPDYWNRVFGELAAASSKRVHVGLVAESDGRTVGFLLGEVRAFEFGSEACGWVFAVGVDRKRARSGVASTLLHEACRRFRGAGVDRVRTMVRRNDVEVMSFFRANGFVGGSFVQLERELEDRE
jgi:ribosomal protein S18 acetylase RimI-like enzyme